MAYPYRIKQVVIYKPPKVLEAFINICKTLVNKKLASRVSYKYFYLCTLKGPFLGIYTLSQIPRKENAALLCLQMEKHRKGLFEYAGERVLIRYSVFKAAILNYNKAVNQFLIP